MSVKISYKIKFSKNKGSNYILFVGDNYKDLNIKSYVSKNEYSFVLDLLKSKNQKKKS